MTKPRKSRSLGAVSLKDVTAIATILCHHNAPVGIQEDIGRYFWKQQTPGFDWGRYRIAATACRSKRGR
jgi:hypothetical protein